jgi:hypothetical protein
MPFDGQDFVVNADLTTLFRERRERAAELWRGVPREAFDLTKWHCDTKACALGWLATWAHDGWKWGWRRAVDQSGAALIPIWSGRGKRADSSAASYFGLTREDARRCFAIGEITAEMEKLTPDDVAQTLLALPYVTP